MTERGNPMTLFRCLPLALVAFAFQHGSFDGQVASFFVMVVAAAEVVVGLGIIVSIYKTRRSTSVDNANLLNQ